MLHWRLLSGQYVNSLIVQVTSLYYVLVLLLAIKDGMPRHVSKIVTMSIVSEYRERQN